MEFRFETKLRNYKILRICTLLFVHTFSELTMTPDLLWKGSRIHIFSVIFVINMIFMNVDDFHVETLIDYRFKVTFAHGFHYLSQDIGTASR